MGAGTRRHDYTPMLPLDLLRAVPLFAGLGKSELELLAQASRRVRYPRKSVVFQEGDPGDYLLVILTGRVKVVLQGEAGEETILATMGPSAFLGEISLIDAAPRSASVMTVEPTEFLRLGRSTFVGLLRAHPAIAGKIMTRLARSLRQATEQIRTLSMFDVHGRVLRCLFVLGSEQHTQWPERLIIRPRPSVKELAMMIGSTRETVSRALKVLQDTGYVTAVDRGLALEPRAIRQYFLPALQNLLIPPPSE